MGPGRDLTRDPGSAVRLASVARHVTDCAMQPSQTGYTNKSILESSHIVMGAANTQPSLYKCAVLSESSLLAYTKNGIEARLRTKKRTSSPPG